MIELITIACFLVAGACGVVRLILGPSLADRVVALDVTLVGLMGAIAVDAARRDDTTYLITLVVLSIVGFTATLAASRFIEDDELSATVAAAQRTYRFVLVVLCSATTQSLPFQHLRFDGTTDLALGWETAFHGWVDK